MLLPELLLLELLDEDDELEDEEESDDEATEVFCFGISTFIFEICRPLMSHSPLYPDMVYGNLLVKDTKLPIKV